MKEKKYPVCNANSRNSRSCSQQVEGQASAHARQAVSRGRGKDSHTPKGHPRQQKPIKGDKTNQ